MALRQSANIINSSELRKRENILRRHRSIREAQLDGVLSLIRGTLNMPFLSRYANLRFNGRLIPIALTFRRHVVWANVCLRTRVAITEIAKIPFIDAELEPLYLANTQYCLLILKLRLRSM